MDMVIDILTVVSILIGIWLGIRGDRREQALFDNYGAGEREALSCWTRLGSIALLILGLIAVLIWLTRGFIGDFLSGLELMVNYLILASLIFGLIAVIGLVWLIASLIFGLIAVIGLVWLILAS